MPRPGHDYFAALDIGTTKVACFIARVDEEGALQIAGLGHQLSQGARCGTITDIEAAESSIVTAVHAAEQMAGVTIDRVMVNLAGTQVLSHNLHVDIPLHSQAVTARDIGRLVEYGRNSQRSQDREVIHCIPIGFSLDDARGIQNPKGMYGHTLGADLHIVTAPQTVIRNLTRCLARAQLDVQEFIVSSYAAGLACLAQDEMELGVTLIDIGGGATSVAVFVDGKPVFTHQIAVGGLHVTNDIARGLSTGIADAERIKALYGSVYASPADDREMIDVPPIGLHPDENGEMQSVPRSMLSGIIRPRMEEIFEMVRGSLEASGFDRVAGRRIVLTGGGSQLLGVADLAGRLFNKQVRIARPRHLQGLKEMTCVASFSAGIGMLEHQANRIRRQRAGEASEADFRPNPLSRAVQWFREKFEA